MTSRHKELKSLNGITQNAEWASIIPDQFSDWVNQRDPNFDNYLALGNKKAKNSMTIFSNYSAGLQTNRDAWMYDMSHGKLSDNVSRMTNTYNNEMMRIQKTPNITKDNISEIVIKDETKISWSSSLLQKILNEKPHVFSSESIRNSLYRPYTKMNLYFDKLFNHRPYQIPSILPKKSLYNLTICITGVGASKSFSVLITNITPDVQIQSNSQCFPLYLYEKNDQTKEHDDLFNQSNEANQEKEYTRKDAITDEALKHFQDAYPDNTITKEDLFYYIYGLLHSEEYREKYADNLTKQLPRIPRVKTYKDFAHFSNAGRELAELHLNYETVPIFDKVKLTAKNGYTTTKQSIKGGADSDYYVTKMKFGKKKDEETNKNVDDKSTVIYNNFITIENIPEEAYDYVVNGKPALEWIMERQSVTTHNDSGITNDANDWAIETMKNARYPLELFLRVITVSLETQKIVNNLPKLDLLKK